MHFLQSFNAGEKKFSQNDGIDYKSCIFDA